MKTIELNFAQRIQLINLLSVQEGTLGKLAPYMRILDAVRFSEEDKQHITRTVEGNKVSFTAPKPEYGRLTVSLETGDLAALEDLIATWPRFTAADGVWVIGLQKALKA
jgi:hypothetical protein